LALLARTSVWSAPNCRLKGQQEVAICRDFYGSYRTGIRDLRPDRPAFTGRARALRTRRLDDRREVLPLRQKRVAGATQIASVLQAPRFRCDVTVFRLNAAAVGQSSLEPAFRRNTAACVYTIEAAHNPEVAGSNPALHADPWIDGPSMRCRVALGGAGFAGATRLEPATSGVTGRYGVPSPAATTRNYRLQQAFPRPSEPAMSGCGPAVPV
jgi:hypothetical protein